MPNAYLSFSLPEKQREYRIAVTAMDWALVVLAIDEHLRNRLKHGELLGSTNAEVISIRDYLYEEIDAHGVSLDMIE
jgi:anti-sigma regulatory factor (Ser/Thr protein kinase)